MTRVLVTGARAPAAAELAVLFSQAGAEVHVADSTPLLLAAGLKCVAEAHRLPSPRADAKAYGGAVATLVARLTIDLVVPTCEEVFYLAAARDVSHAIPLFAPDLAGLRSVHDKATFIDIARLAGLDVPSTRLLTSRADLAALASETRQLVLKPCFSRFGVATKVGVAQSALSDVHPTKQAPWIAQELLHGNEICSYGVASHGKLIAFAAYRPLYRMGRAASYYFEPVKSVDGERIAKAIVEATGFHGQIAFDMIETADRGLLPIECNPRATSGVHLFRNRPELATLMLGDAPDSVLRPDASAAPSMVASAMILFGARYALRNPDAWRRDLRRGRDVLDFAGNSLNARAWRVFASYCAEALKTRQSLRSIATSDIEWNGEALDAGA